MFLKFLCVFLLTIYVAIIKINTSLSSNIRRKLFFNSCKNYKLSKGSIFNYNFILNKLLIKNVKSIHKTKIKNPFLDSHFQYNPNINALENIINNRNKKLNYIHLYNDYKNGCILNKVNRNVNQKIYTRKEDEYKRKSNLSEKYDSNNTEKKNNIMKKDINNRYISKKEVNRDKLLNRINDLKIKDNKTNEIENNLKNANDNQQNMDLKINSKEKINKNVNPSQLNNANNNDRIKPYNYKYNYTHNNNYNNNNDIIKYTNDNNENMKSNKDINNGEHNPSNTYYKKNSNNNIKLDSIYTNKNEMSLNKVNRNLINNENNIKEETLKNKKLKDLKFDENMGKTFEGYVYNVNKNVACIKISDLNKFGLLFKNKSNLGEDIDDMNNFFEVNQKVFVKILGINIRSKMYYLGNIIKYNENIKLKRGECSKGLITKICESYCFIKILRNGSSGYLHKSKLFVSNVNNNLESLSNLIGSKKDKIINNKNNLVKFHFTNIFKIWDIIDVQVLGESDNSFKSNYVLTIPKTSETFKKIIHSLNLDGENKENQYNDNNNNNLKDENELKNINSIYNDKKKSTRKKDKLIDQIEYQHTKNHNYLKKNREPFDKLNKNSKQYQLPENITISLLSKTIKISLSSIKKFFVINENKEFNSNFKLNSEQIKKVCEYFNINCNIQDKNNFSDIRDTVDHNYNEINAIHETNQNFKDKIYINQINKNDIYKSKIDKDKNDNIIIDEKETDKNDNDYIIINKNVKDKIVDDKNIENKIIIDKKEKDKNSENKIIDDKKEKDKNSENKIIDDKKEKDKKIKNKIMVNKKEKDKNIEDEILVNKKERKKNIEEKVINDEKENDKNIKNEIIVDRKEKNKNSENKIIVDRKEKNKNSENKIIVDKKEKDNNTEDEIMENKKEKDQNIEDKKEIDNGKKCEVNVIHKKLKNKEKKKNNNLTDILSKDNDLKKGNKDNSCIKKRNVVVTFIGHINHGKTSLFDYICKTDERNKEYGLITQNIRAFKATVKDEYTFTFIDTPGHEAFMPIRSRGVKISDLSILVISGEEGIQEQTIECIKLIKEFNIKIIIAITKVDLTNVYVDRIIDDLLYYGISTELNGGEIQVIECSIFKDESINKLLDAISLESEFINLDINNNEQASGVILDSYIDKTGIVSVNLLQSGTLKVNDYFYTGFSYGKIKVLKDHLNRNIKCAYSSDPIKVIGYNKNSLPKAGDKFFVVENESIAREIAEHNKNEMLSIEMNNFNYGGENLDIYENFILPNENKSNTTILLDENKSNEQNDITAKNINNNVNSNINEKNTILNSERDNSNKDEHKLNNISSIYTNSLTSCILNDNDKSLYKSNLKNIYVNYFIKCDKQGTIDVLKNSILKLEKEDSIYKVKNKIVYANIGDISSSDINYAVSFNAIIIGFNVKISKNIGKNFKKPPCKILFSNVLYELIEKIEEEMKNRLSVKPNGNLVGEAKILKVFNISKLGKVAGCVVTSGYINNNSNVRILRNDKVIYMGKLISLKIIKEEKTQVVKNDECGMGFENFVDFLPDDIIESYEE